MPVSFDRRKSYSASYRLYFLSSSLCDLCPDLNLFVTTCKLWPIRVVWGF